MKTNLTKVYSMKNFFSIIETNQKRIKYKLTKPSIILAHNIYMQWLQSIWKKADTHFPVYLNKPQDLSTKKLPVSYLNRSKVKISASDIFEHSLLNSDGKTKMCFNLLVPQQDIMQYYIQWQRYRKYWWSTITTTPSLFSIGDMRNSDGMADVDIIAQFPWGQSVVENLSVKMDNPDVNSSSILSCTSTMEDALVTTLSDGAINSTKEGYLRLQRDIAPYKIAFAVENGDKSDALYKLAAVLNNQLRTKNISSLFPQTIVPLQSQIEEYLQLGVIYTAILSSKTLNDGILHLLNSSTMLKEQVHVADLTSYSEILFKTGIK